MPPFDVTSFDLSLTLPHDLCGSLVLVWPGGGPFFVGQGGRALAATGFAVRTAGSGVARCVGRGVGRAVGAGGGFGVAAGVGRAVGADVGALVGAAVGATVGCVTGCCAPVGAGVEPGWTPGGADARPEVGDGSGPDGEASGPDGVGRGAEGVGSLGGPLPPAGCVPVGEPIGDGVVTTATGGWPDGVVRCWSPTPPIPNAIVARTRFRTPRLRMSRAR